MQLSRELGPGLLITRPQMNQQYLNHAIDLKKSSIIKLKAWLACAADYHEHIKFVFRAIVLLHKCSIFYNN